MIMPAIFSAALQTEMERTKQREWTDRLHIEMDNDSDHDDESENGPRTT